LGRVQRRITRTQLDVEHKILGRGLGADLYPLVGIAK